MHRHTGNGYQLATANIRCIGCWRLLKRQCLVCATDEPRLSRQQRIVLGWLR